MCGEQIKTVWRLWRDDRRGICFRIGEEGIRHQERERDWTDKRRWKTEPSVTNWPKKKKTFLSCHKLFHAILFLFYTSDRVTLQSPWLRLPYNIKNVVPVSFTVFVRFQFSSPSNTFFIRLWYFFPCFLPYTMTHNSPSKFNQSYHGYLEDHSVSTYLRVWVVFLKIYISLDIYKNTNPLYFPIVTSNAVMLHIYCMILSHDKNMFDVI